MVTTNLFKKKIVCGYCGKFHIGKNERGKLKFVCSKYNKNSKECQRNMVTNEQLLELLDMRFKRLLTQEEINLLINYINVTDNKIEIILNNNQEPIILSETFAQF